MDFSSQVSDSLVPNVYMNPVCKLGSSDMDFSDTESLCYNWGRGLSGPSSYWL